MNCRDVRPLLARYVDGDTDGYEHTLLEEHLAECSACAGEVSQLRLTRQRVQREFKRWAASAVPPTSARERLLARLAAEKETATTMTHPGNPIGGILSRKIALLRRIAFATLVTLLVAAIIALLLSDALRSQ